MLQIGVSDIRPRVQMKNLIPSIIVQKPQNINEWLS